MKIKCGESLRTSSPLFIAGLKAGTDGRGKMAGDAREMRTGAACVCISATYSVTAVRDSACELPWLWWPLPTFTRAISVAYANAI